MPTVLRSLYFFYYAGAGILLAHFGVYLKGLGLSGEDIGFTMSLPALVAPGAALLWGIVADRTGARTRTLQRVTSLALLGLALLPWVTGARAIACVLVLQALFERAIVPLLDAITLHHVQRTPKIPYARIRAVGSIGFMLATYVLGQLLAWRPFPTLVPVAMFLCGVGYLISARLLPNEPEGRSHKNEPSPSLRTLLRNAPFLWLVASATLHWMACTPYHLFFGILVKDLGLPPTVTGSAMALGVLFEVCILWVVPRLLRFGTPWLLAIAYVGSAIRWLSVSHAESPLALILLQALHALTFGLFWSGAMHALSSLIPTELRATGQAFFGAIVFGVGNAAGYFLSGLGYDRAHGAAPLFFWASFVEGASVLLILVAAKKGITPQAEGGAAGRGSG